MICGATFAPTARQTHPSPASSGRFMRSPYRHRTSAAGENPGEERHVPGERVAGIREHAPFCFPHIRLICATLREGRAHAPNSHTIDRRNCVRRGPRHAARLQVRIRPRDLRLHHGQDGRDNSGGDRNACSGRGAGPGTSSGAGTVGSIQRRRRSHVAGAVMAVPAQCCLRASKSSARTAGLRL